MNDLKKFQKQLEELHKEMGSMLLNVEVNKDGNIEILRAIKKNGKRKHRR